jgi:hypothetical protein
MNWLLAAGGAYAFALAGALPFAFKLHRQRVAIWRAAEPPGDEW